MLHVDRIVHKSSSYLGIPQHMEPLWIPVVPWNGLIRLGHFLMIHVNNYCIYIYMYDMYTHIYILDNYHIGDNIIKYPDIHIIYIYIYIISNTNVCIYVAVYSYKWCQYTQTSSFDLSCF